MPACTRDDYHEQADARLEAQAYGPETRYTGDFSVAYKHELYDLTVDPLSKENYYGHYARSGGSILTKVDNLEVEPLKRRG